MLHLPKARRLATLVALLEASAQDDAIELLDLLLSTVRQDPKEDKTARLRSLKDLDELAITLVDACKPIVYSSPTKRRLHFNNMSAFCHLIHRI